MAGRAGSPTGIVYADMTLTRSKVKVTGLLNFRKLPKLCMLAAMTVSPLVGLCGPVFGLVCEPEKKVHVWYVWFEFSSVPVVLYVKPPKAFLC